jgi:hypothetical protein
MSTTSTYDYTVRAGNSGTVENEAGIVITLTTGTPGVVMDLTGQTIHFWIKNVLGAEAVAKTDSGDITVDIGLGKITVPITVAESRLIEAAGAADQTPTGSVLKYEIERRNGGEQRAVLAGRILLELSLNDD